MHHCQTKNTPQSGHPGTVEFIALMAFTMSLVALAIDAMLPAFPEMARDLQVVRANDTQLVISVLFIGLAFGQIFYGPLSDTIGRKPAMYFGFGLFLLGSVLSMTATTYLVMLVGRTLQGIGAAGPRVVAMALIRDRFHGDAMARVMSFIMTVFILVPIFAPAFGQAILWFAGWRSIFASFVILAFMTMVWLGVRQPETLARDRRRPFTLKSVRNGFREVLRNRPAMAYTLVAGCISGAFFGYLNVSPQIYQMQYKLGVKFPLYFAILATAVGLASLLNTGMVMRFGMHALARRSLLLMMMVSWVFLGLVWIYQGHPPLWLFIAICFALFFCVGVLFGNLNSMAMEPLGHLAGTAAAVIGFFTTLLAVALGFIIGHAYDGSLLPMAAGFAGLSSISVLLIIWPESQRKLN